MQAARIQHLEALLMSTGFNSMPSAPFSWSGPPSGSGPFQADLPTQLEVMRPSPEPPVWSGGMIGYDDSPPELSSNSVVTAFRRSSSLSTGEDSAEGQYISPADMQSPDAVGSEEKRGRQMERILRKDPSADIQVSLSGMDLDSMFGAPREDETGRLRW